MTSITVPGTKTLAAVLNGLVYNVFVNGQTYSGKVFQVAAALTPSGQTPPSVTSTVNYFENIALSVKASPGATSDYLTLQRELNWAFQNFFAFSGVPQLISPSHVEAHMAAQRIEAIGGGAVLRGKQTSKSVESALARLKNDGDQKKSKFGLGRPINVPISRSVRCEGSRAARALY